MAVQILPTTPSPISQNELEDLIFQADPGLEEVLLQSDDDLACLTGMLRTAVEHALLAYHQSHYLVCHAQSLELTRRLEVSESIAQHYRQATAIAASKTLETALALFLRNVELAEEDDHAPAHQYH